MNELKNAIINVQFDGTLQKFFVVTGIDAVGIEMNEDYTIKKSLRQGLAEFAEALEEKANSSSVTGEIQAACQDLYNKILGKVDDTTTINEAYDTLKEIADWIGAHGSAAATLTSDISTLKTNVENLTQQIENSHGTSVEASETNGNIKVDGEEIEVYKNPGKTIFVASTAAEAAAVTEKMKDGDILFQIGPEPVELKDASDEVKVANHFIGTADFTYYNGLSEEQPYTFEKVCCNSNDMEVNDIVYISADTVIYSKIHGSADLSTGKLSGGNTHISSGEMVLPAGYYKVKTWFEITNLEVHYIRIVFGTFDSSGNVATLTAETFNEKNRYLEYLGESYLVTI